MLHYMIYRVHKMKTFFVSGTECREKPFLLEFYNENECSEQCPSNSLRINARMNSLSCIWCPSMSANSMKFQRHNAVKAAPQKRLNDVLGTVLWWRPEVSGVRVTNGQHWPHPSHRYIFISPCGHSKTYYYFPQLNWEISSKTQFQFVFT